MKKGPGPSSPKPAVSSVGLGFHHPPGFTIDRPEGFSGEVFVHFLVPVQIRTVEGLQRAGAHACVIYTAEQPEWYTGDGVGLKNNWFHAAGTRFRSLAKRHGLPLNRILRPARTDFIPLLLAEMRSELTRMDDYSVRQLELLLERLCASLARALHNREGKGLSSRQIELRELLRSLRQSLYDRSHEPWTVEQMAARAHLSVSRFSPLYRQFFGVSPHDDLLDARLERAKWLLGSTTVKVSAVAEQCGFASLCHFSRLFRKRVGCPPTAYHPSSAC